MYRLFVAIDLPDLVRDSVSALADKSIMGAKWVPRDQLHLTLRFIGDADERMFLEIRNVLESVKGNAFSLSLRGIGHFPHRGAPRVLWVRVEGSAELCILQSNIEREILNVGIEAEKRGFSPHITIARLKDSSPARVLNLEEKHLDFGAGPFPVNEFYLYSSTLTRDGAIHKREAVYRLA